MIGLISIMITDEHAADGVNAVLHAYRGAVLGRMGLPLKDRGVSVISIVVDATPGEINALTGKLGRLQGVKAKAVYGDPR